MIKFFFLCFVPVCFTSVQAYTEEDLESNAHEVSHVLRFMPNAHWDHDRYIIINQTVDELHSTKY